ncbi:CocE/NonD family hydrolase [Sphingobium sp. DC-2]|uniref:CocE/NonD family hydrolase n=1 Tax=Sphingobium sp. DC-2 TaxID=1303256 RepID=UPI0004C411D4|nr:CocE/NonD family hydrolase [Sphingobium sp. DC-2]
MMEFQRFGPSPLPDDAVSQPVTVRDGVKLATDLYGIDETKPSPTILIRTPYDKCGPIHGLPQVARRFVEAGYSVAVQDVRGKFRSEGATEFQKHEADDSYDVIDWVSRQPWNNGSVAMWGISYYGFVTLAAASSGHPALKAIAPRVTGSQLAHNLRYRDGSREVEPLLSRWYYGQAYVENDLFGYKLDVKKLPLSKLFDEFFDEIGYRSADFDASFKEDFRERGLSTAQLLSHPVPTLYTVGWYDFSAGQSWADIDRLSASPAWAGKLHLQLEAIDHDGYSLDQAPMTEADLHWMNPAVRQAMLDRMMPPAIAFFNHYLRGGPPVPRVRYEVCHGSMKASGSWPPEPSRAVQLYLDQAQDGAGTIALAPGAPSQVQWEHDGNNLITSVGGFADAPAGPGSVSLFMAWPDFAEMSKRPDVVSFRSAPMRADVELAGPVDLFGRIGSTLDGTDIFVRLLDEAPDGTQRQITRGQIHVEGVRAPGAGELTPFHVPSMQTAYRLAAGHRLALQIFSSDFPEFVPNGGAGVDPWLVETVPSSTQVLELGGEQGAMVRLTVGMTAEAVSAAFPAA